mmetsp:Transcript_23633/g.67788  ORF Transcript_23633/g.67788 Transcript_23633/m.67788 type:complete len:483 (-) Transcript_23633:175-1623(-)
MAAAATSAKVEPEAKVDAEEQSEAKVAGSPAAAQSTTAASSPVSILSTSPMTSTGGGAGDRVPGDRVPALTSAAASPTAAGSSAAAAGKPSSIFSTSPNPRGHFYLQAAGMAEILRTSPTKPSSTNPAATSAAGGISVVGLGDGSATTPARFAHSLGKFFMDPADLPSGAHTPRSDDCDEVYKPLDNKGEKDDGEDEDGEDKEYHIKNTFIDTPLQRSPSLEKFIGIRRVNSSPPALFEQMLTAQPDPFGMQPGRCGSEQGREADVCGADNSRQLLEEELLSGAHTDSDSSSNSDVGGSTRAGTQAGSGQLPEARMDPCTASAGSASTACADGVVLVAGVQVGTAEYPSRGSALHKFGACKPCAFVGHGVCRNGLNCQFCHLCEPGEKKRRRKEWLETKRQARRQTEVGMWGGKKHGAAMFQMGLGAYAPNKSVSARQQHRMQQQFLDQHYEQQAMMAAQAVTFLSPVMHQHPGGQSLLGAR